MPPTSTSCRSSTTRALSPTACRRPRKCSSRRPPARCSASIRRSREVLTRTQEVADLREQHDLVAHLFLCHLSARAAPLLQLLERAHDDEQRGGDDEEVDERGEES